MLLLGGGRDMDWVINSVRFQRQVRIPINSVPINSVGGKREA